MPGLLFIHTDFAPQSTREGQLQKAKARAHAAAFSHPSARAIREKRFSKSVNRASDAVTASLPIRNNGDDDEPAAQSDRRHRPRSDSSSCPNSANSTVGEQRSLGRARKKAVIRRGSRRHDINQHLLSIQPGFGWFPTEFFSYISGGNDTEVKQIVMSYTHAALRSIDVSCELFDLTNMFSVHVLGWQDAMIYHAAISGMALTAGPVADYFRLHRCAAIRKVRSILQRPDVLQDDGLLLGILFLAVIERLTGNPVGSIQHFSALTQIINVRGGLKALRNDSPAKLAIMRTDGLMALMTGTTLFEGQRRRFSPVYPVAPFSPETQDTIRILPAGYADLVKDGELSQDAIDTLERAVRTELTNFSETRQQERAQRRSVTRRYFDPLEAVPCIITPDCDEIVLEKMICWAMYVCCWFDRVTLRSSLGIYGRARRYITDRLPAFQTTKQSVFQCSLWMWIIAIDSWRTPSSANPLLPEGLSLLTIFVQRFPLLSDDWSAIENVVRHFFHTEELLRYWRYSWARLASNVEKAS